jgi:hypothetical protein
MEDDWFKTAQEIEQRLQKLDSILGSDKPEIEIKAEISDVEEPILQDDEDDEMVGIYVAIAPYYPTDEQTEANPAHCPVRLGEVIKITEVIGDYGFGYKKLI